MSRIPAAKDEWPREEYEMRPEVTIKDLEIDCPKFLSDRMLKRYGILAGSVSTAACLAAMLFGLLQLGSEIAFQSVEETLAGVFLALGISLGYGLIGGLLAFYCLIPCYVVVAICNYSLGRPTRYWFFSSLVGGLTGTVALSLSLGLANSLARVTSPSLLLLHFLSLALCQILTGWCLADHAKEIIKKRKLITGKRIPLDQTRNICAKSKAHPFTSPFLRHPLKASFDLRSLILGTAIAALLAAICRYSGYDLERIILPFAIWAVGQIIMVPLFWILIQAKHWLSQRRNASEPYALAD